jgi:hypothetical protein
MNNVPDLMQRIAGKSIPLEVSADCYGRDFRRLTILSLSTMIEIRRSTSTQIHRSRQPPGLAGHRARLCAQLSRPLAAIRAL